MHRLPPWISLRSCCNGNTGRGYPAFSFCIMDNQDNPIVFPARYAGSVMEMNPFHDNMILHRFEQLIQRMELLHLAAFLRYVHDWKKRLLFDFLSGIARGVGFSIGFSVLGALLLYLLRNMALSNLPVIGQFVAQLVRIVENNLGK